MSGLGDMGNLLKQAQEMQRQMDKVKSELRTRGISGSSASGDVRIELSADRQEVRSVHVSEDLLRSSAAEVSERIQGALSDALRRAQDVEKEEIGRVTGGMQLPGFF